MKETFIPLIEKHKLFNGFRQAFVAHKMKLLLIHINDNTYLIENKCGHFGLALDGGWTEKQQKCDVIICNHHSISFDLSTGQVVNRPWETCDPITILNAVIKENVIGFYV